MFVSQELGFIRHTEKLKLTNLLLWNLLKDYRAAQAQMFMEKRSELVRVPPKTF